MSKPTDYTAQLYVQASEALPDLIAAAKETNRVSDPLGSSFALIDGPIEAALAKAGADCCVADKLGLTAMMLAQLAQQYSDLRRRIEELGGDLHG